MISLSKNPYVYALWALVLGGVGWLVYSHRLDWMVGSGFLLTLGLPSVLAATKIEDKAP